MSDFLSTYIKKDNKKLKGAKKVPQDYLNTIDTGPNFEKLKGTDTLPKTEKLKGIDSSYKGEKLKGIDINQKEKPKSEDTMAIDLLMGDAKKKKSSKPEYETIKTKELSPWGEQSEANEKAFKKKKYEDSVKKFKKGK